MSILSRRDSKETDRLLTLSDGVIAIAITLLVLDITVPTVPPESSEQVLLRGIFEQWQQFVGFVLSFWGIGFYWMLHRRTFIHIDQQESGVVFLNLLFLLFVAFIPYATSVFATYPNRTGIVFLATVLAVCGVSLAVLWIYASRNQLVEEGLTSRTVQIQATRFLSTPLVFGVSIVVAFFDTGLAMLTWVLLIPINGALESRFVESLEGGT